MTFAPVTVAALLVLHCCSSAAYLERNPALQKYQNQATASPLEETWYMLYRNYLSDPYFGGTAKCLRFSPKDRGQCRAHCAVAQYNPGRSHVVTTTLSSTPGYTLKNVLNIDPHDRLVTVPVVSAFLDVNTCGVYRAPYKSDLACSLLVPKSQLGESTTCCDFVFDLLCGSGNKYVTYESSCP